ncbi:MAG: metal-dependent transcriptional regulator, partial [Spirochaetia bacterium]
MDINELHDKFPAAADYLSQIYLIKRDYAQVTNLRLSERLKVSKPAVTQSVKRLSKLDLVQQDRYGVINLTDEGRDVAKAVLERHYLIEHVLVDMLGYPWEKSDRE